MEWIETLKQLPSKSCAVLCFFKMHSCEVMSVEWYSLDQNDFLPLEENGNVLNTPTHWMYLPEKPKAI